MLRRRREQQRPLQARKVHWDSLVSRVLQRLLPRPWQRMLLRRPLWVLRPSLPIQTQGAEY
jgi:hypothetical protein